ncbi:hypothetical protein B7494_g2201 [Chlorociboria aeruginascens]|nr:hypothetical protein B7494_g2201 [Chlorociboria aeruginascens]
MPIQTSNFTSEKPSNSETTDLASSPTTQSDAPPSQTPATTQKTEAEEAADRLYEERIEEEYAKREGVANRGPYFLPHAYSQQPIKINTITADPFPNFYLFKLVITLGLYITAMASRKLTGDPISYNRLENTNPSDVNTSPSANLGKSQPNTASRSIVRRRRPESKSSPGTAMSLVGLKNIFFRQTLTPVPANSHRENNSDRYNGPVDWSNVSRQPLLDSSSQSHMNASFDDGSITDLESQSVDSKIEKVVQRKGFRIDARVISDATIGLSDGLTVPFALTAGLSALGNTRVVIYGGFAELIAGAISMGLGGYLGAKSEAASYLATKDETEQLIATNPQTVMADIAEIFEPYNLPKRIIDDLTTHLAQSPRLGDFVMQFQHCAEEPASSRAVTSAITIALGYFLGGLLPLIPYFFVGRNQVYEGLYISIGVMVLALFLFGYVKTAVVVGWEGGRNIRAACFGGVQMVIVGSAAAGAAMGLPCVGINDSNVLRPCGFHNYNKMSSSSGTPESWISSFCSLLGHEYFAEVSEDFIEDDFNLTGLQTQVAMYKEALEMILDVEPEEDEDEEEEEEEEEEGDESIEGEDHIGSRRAAAERRHHRMASDLSIIESSAEMLYGLIHQRFICSRAGIQQMSEKYELAHFGVCPRTYCDQVKTLPVGLSDVPGEDTVKLFCPSCLDVYVPPNSRFQTVDGAFFGRTFGALFLLTFPDYDISKKATEVLTGQARSVPASHSADGEEKEKVNGMNIQNLAPGLGRDKVYEPKIYGFRVSERAKSGPRMGWLRKRPSNIHDLDEARKYAALHADDSDEDATVNGAATRPRQRGPNRRPHTNGSPMSIEADGDGYA